MEPAPEALDHRHGAALTVAQSLPAGAAAVVAEDRAYEDPEDGAAEGVVEGEPVAEPMGDGEHPLPDWDGGEHLLYEIRRPLGHAPPPTARAHRPRLARERDQPLEGAALAPHAKKTVDVLSGGFGRL